MEKEREVVVLKQTSPKLFESCPESSANIFSKYTYSWITPLLLKGTKEPIQPEDLTRPYPCDLSTEMSKRIDREWETEMEGFRNEGKSPSISAVLYRMLFNETVIMGIMRFVADMLGVVSPFLIQGLVNFVVRARSSKPQQEYVGYLYAVGFFLLQEVSSLLSNRFFQIAQTQSIVVRGAFYGVIYRKSTRLSLKSRQNFNAGKVVNLISTDVNRIETFLLTANSTWTAPIQILVLSILLCVILGPAALVGIGILLGLGPLQGRLFAYLGKLRKDQAPITDDRVKQTQEIIEGIRVIKFFAWEVPYLNTLDQLRSRELSLILKRNLIQAFVLMIAFSIPVLAASLSFVVYALTNSTLEPGIIFASLAWFSQLRFPLMFLPRILVGYADFKIAVVRLTELFLAEELVDYVEKVDNVDYAISITDGEFKWEGVEPEKKEEKAEKKAGRNSKKQVKSEEAKPAKEEGKAKEDEDDNEDAQSFTLSSLNLTIPKGKLVAIVGAVGSGKSTILNTLVGETKKVKGSVKVSGTIGYAPQQAWIQNASVKDNILFGQPYDHDRYFRAIHICALERDLEIFPDGDQTEIGERGINLSGGQKQRINLARLVYYNPDIVLMDDPLSAVDAHVGRFLFDQCISSALKDKTRVLVTHQLHVLPSVDFIYVMKDGVISEEGTYNDLMQSGKEFSTMMKNYGNGEEEAAKGDVEVSEIDTARIAAAVHGDKDDHRKLMQTEERMTGTVKKDIWWTYFAAAGGAPFLILLFILLLINQGFNVGNNFWLVIWTNGSIKSFSNTDYVLVYMALSLGVAFATYGIGTFLAFHGVKAARVLHNDAFKRVLRAPSSFYDSTPLGRIINRFSKDIDQVDNTLMDTFRMFIFTLFQTIATFVLIAYATPMFLIPLVPVFGMYYMVQNLYRSSSRELKRIDSIARSPLFALVGETLTGLSTIRAYNEQGRFVTETTARIEKSIIPSYYQFSAVRWLGIRFELLGSTLLFFAAMFGVLARNNASFSAALLGLSLSYAVQVTSSLNWCARQFTETEIAMNSVERVHYYGHEIPVEAPATIEATQPAETWPAEGTLEFENVEMKYLPELPLVLQKISFKLKGNEKVGIVGRTGSGKSSIIQAAFRFIEICGGRILIDGVDISKIGLQDLRTKIGIIPQDPVLFSGTFRKNLDPFSNYDDNELWSALERSQMKSKISQCGGLDGAILEGGSNLSVGERQLLCLARALLQKTKILFMDEATANVDFESDSAIQKCIRVDFADCTVITIAHRLNTILDYDRVMVLDQGKILEFDNPQTLIQAKGKFYEMVESAKHE